MDMLTLWQVSVENVLNMLRERVVDVGTNRSRRIQLIWDGINVVDQILEMQERTFQVMSENHTRRLDSEVGLPDFAQDSDDTETGLTDGDAAQDPGDLEAGLPDVIEISCDLEFDFDDIPEEEKRDSEV